MSQSSGQPQWTWDNTTRRYYYYDARIDSYVYQDGQRIPRSVPAALPNVRAQDIPSSPTFPPQYVLRSGASPDPLTMDFANLQLQNTTGRPRPIRPQVWEDNQGRFVEAANPDNAVSTRIQTGPADRITDPNLLRAGIRAERLLMGTGGDTERLFENFRRRDRPKTFFTVGKVFRVLWVEPAGESNTVVTSLEPGTSYGRFGEPVFSKVRRFVVVREADNYCSALPIASYSGRGVAKQGVKKSEHGIIFTGKVAPEPLVGEEPSRGERGMRPDPIRVNPDNPADKLDDNSRIDYGKVHTIQHNIKVQSFGQVHPKSLNALLHQFRNVWADPSASGISGGDTGGAGPSGGGNGSSAPAAVQRDVRPGGRATSQAPRSATSGGSQPRSGDGDSQARAQSSEVARAAQARAAVQRLVGQGYSAQKAEQLVSERYKALAEQNESSSESGSDDEAVTQGSARSQRSGGQPSSRAKVVTNPPTAQGQNASRAHAQSSSSSQAPAQGSRGQQSRTQQAPPMPQPQVQPQQRTTGQGQSATAQGQTQAAPQAAVVQLMQRGYSRDEAVRYIAQQLAQRRPS